MKKQVNTLNQVIREERKRNEVKEVRSLEIEHMDRDINRKVVIKSRIYTKAYTMVLGESVRDRINLRPGNRIL